MLDPWTWRMAWRDSKGSRRRLALFLSAMVVGVAALVAIISFGYSLERTVDRDAGSLLGGDLRIASSDPFTLREEALIDSLGGTQARRISFSAQAQYSGSESSQMVLVRAMEPEFPLYGAFAVSPPDAVARMHRDGGVLASRSAVSSIDVEPGDSVIIRGRPFMVQGLLLGTRVENFVQMLMESPVYMPLADLDSLQSNAARYEVFFRFDRDVELAPLAARIDSTYEVSVETLEEKKADWQEFLGILEGFLGLVGFFALILGGLGVGSVLQVHLRERRDTVAVLRCLGASTRRASSVYLAQAIAMGAIVGVAAGIVGMLGQVVVPLGVADLLPLDIDFHVSPKGLLAGLGLGIGGTLVFALLPLSGLPDVSPLEALRSAYGRRRFRKSRLGVYAAVALGIFVCAVLQVEDLLVAVVYTVAMGICFGVLALAAFVFVRLARALTPLVRNYAVRQGMANLHRPNNQTLLMVLALGLGTVLILTQVLVEGAVTKRMLTLEFAEEMIPDLVLSAVPSKDHEDILDLARTHNMEIINEQAGLLVHVDSVYGRAGSGVHEDATGGRDIVRLDSDTTSMAGEAANSSLYLHRRRVFRAEFANASTDSILVEVEEGTYQSEWHEPEGTAPVAVTSRFAEDLVDVSVGDTMRLSSWDGDTVTVRVGSIINSIAGFGPETSSIKLPRGTLQALPHNVTIMLTAEDAHSLSLFFSTVTDRYPGLPAFNVPLVMGVLKEVLNRIRYMVQFMAMFCIVAGIMVLAGAVMVSRQARLEQTVLLKALGAAKRQIYTIMCVEYLCLGLLAIAVGLGLAMLAAWAATGFLLDVVFIVPKLPIVLASVGLLVLTLGVGLLNSRGIYARPPLEALRADA